VAAPLPGAATVILPRVEALYFSGAQSATPPKRSMIAQRRWFSHRALKFPSQQFVCTGAAKVHEIFSGISAQRFSGLVAGLLKRGEISELQITQRSLCCAAAQQSLIGTFYLHYDWETGRGCWSMAASERSRLQQSPLPWRDRA
jgi:hypothetical protein